MKQYRLDTNFDRESARTEMVLVNVGEWVRTKDHETDKAAAVEQATRELRAEKDAAKREVESMREQSIRQLFAICSLLGDRPENLVRGDPGWSVAYQEVRKRLESSKAVEHIDTIHDEPAVPAHGPAPLTDAERDARIRRLERWVTGDLGSNEAFSAIDADAKAGR